MLVRFSLAVGKEIFGVAKFAPIVYFPGKPWADFDSAGLAPLASDRQCYPGELGVPKSVSFVVTDHAADEEVQQESFFGIGMPVEQGQFVFGVGDDLFLVVAGIFFFLEQPTYAELLQEYCDVADLVAIGAFRIRVSALRQRLLAGSAHEVEHVLLGHIFNTRLLAGLDEWVDASTVGSDAFGILPPSFEIGEVSLGRLRERRALRDSCRLHRRVFGLVNELAAHPLRFERVGASFDPGFFVTDAVRAFFVLFFLSADHHNVRLDLAVRVYGCSAVTPLAADLDVLVKLEFWVGHLISSLLPNTGFLRSPQVA
jgi:hypothetical protein